MSANQNTFSYRHQEENRTCWKYNSLCQTDAFQWLMNHHMYDKHLLDLTMDYCGESAYTGMAGLDER
jgi:hypothetical protein